MWQSPNVFKGLELIYSLKLSCFYSRAWVITVSPLRQLLILQSWRLVLATPEMLQGLPLCALM